MRFGYGSTRFVLLMHNNAYKFARIRVLIFLGRLLFVLPFSRKGREHFLKKYGPGYRSAMLNDLFAGIYANRREYAYWCASSDKRVIPTTHFIFGGLLVIQPRGLPLPEPARFGIGLDEIIPVDLIGVEIVRACQYSIHPRTKRVVLVDYGNATIIELLRSTFVSA